MQSCSFPRSWVQKHLLVSRSGSDVTRYAMLVGREPVSLPKGRCLIGKATVSCVIGLKRRVNITLMVPR